MNTDTINNHMESTERYEAKELSLDVFKPLDAEPAGTVSMVLGVVRKLKKHLQASPANPWLPFECDPKDLCARAIGVGWNCGLIRITVLHDRQDNAKHWFCAAQEDSQ